MDYAQPRVLEELGLGQEDDSPKSVLEMYKNLSPAVTNYTVKRGDTLSELAERFGTTVREIVRMNPQIRDVNKIVAGKDIDIPGKPQPVVAMPLIDRVPGAMEDAIESSTGIEELLMNGGALKGIAAAGMGAMLPKVMQNLAGRAPMAQTAGQFGNNMVRGAVNHPGAMPSMSNVAPMANAGQGNMMAKMAMMKQRIQQPLGQGGQMPQGGMPPINAPQQGMAPQGFMRPSQGGGQTLGSGARMPWLGAGTRAPQSGREGMLQELIAASRKEPTLDDLQSVGIAHPGVPFKDLLRKVGYNQR
jgi:LysM repeat protein